MGPRAHPANWNNNKVRNYYMGPLCKCIVEQEHVTWEDDLDELDESEEHEDFWITESL